MSQAIVSVIIRQHNELPHLERLYQAIRAQDQAGAELGIELVVVDSGSRDGSRELAAKLADRLVEIPPEDFTFGYALNCGIRAAQGEIIVIASAHTYPKTPQWISKLIAPLSREQACMTYGRQSGDTLSNPGELTDFEVLYGPRARIQKKPDYFCNNANSAIKRELWKKHPFDESLSGLEDIAWSKHFLDLGMELVYVPEAEIVHLHREAPRQIRNRFYREALALRRLGLKRRWHLPTDLAKELAVSGIDLAKTSSWEDFRNKLNYRGNKFLGHARGVINGRKDESSLKQDLRKILDITHSRAVVVHGPGDLSLEWAPVPDLAPTDVLIQPAYVGICGTDREIAAGTLGYYRNGVAQYPITLGHEYSGTIAKIGVKVTGLSVGDPVIGECILTCGHCEHCTSHHRLHCSQRKEVGVLHVNGALASFVKVPASRIHKIPAGLSLRKAALTEPAAVVTHALKVAGLWNPAPSTRVLILGAGSLGHLAAKILVSKGLSEISVVEKSEYKRSLIAGTVKRTASTLAEDWVRSADVALEFTGDGELLDTLLKNALSESLILLVGFPYESTRIVPENLVANQLDVRGSLGADSSDFKDALEVLGKIDVEPYLKHLFPLPSFQEALKNSSREDAFKTMIAVNPPAESGKASRSS